MGKITRAELINLAGLSATVYAEGYKGEGMYRLHTKREIDFVKRNGVKITRRKNGSFFVIVGGNGTPTE